MRVAATVADRAGAALEELLVERQCQLQQIEQLAEAMYRQARAMREELRREAAAASGQLLSA